VNFGLLPFNWQSFQEKILTIKSRYKRDLPESFVGHVFNVTVKLYNIQSAVLGGSFFRLSPN